MAKLILIRHSIPEVDTSVTASEWRLSDVGRQKCLNLACELVGHQLDVIVTSTEPKAAETAEIVARALGKSWGFAEGLHEHLRRNVGFLDKSDFEAKVAEFFEKPDRLVFGEETANQAYQRFEEAIRTLVQRHEEGNLAVVTHGAVLTLFVSRKVGLEPVAFWKQLALPAFIVLSLPDYKSLAI